jgi:hypothetical protein
MTAKEAENFLQASSDKVCVSIRRRSDGRIVTDNCPRALRAARRRLIKVATVVGLTFVFDLIAKAAGAQGLIGAPIDGGTNRSNSIEVEPSSQGPQQFLSAILFLCFCLPGWLTWFKGSFQRLRRAHNPALLACSLIGSMLAPVFLAVIFSAEFSLTETSHPWVSFLSHLCVAVIAGSVLISFSTLWQYGKISATVLILSIMLGACADRVYDLYPWRENAVTAIVFVSLFSAVASFACLFSKKPLRMKFMELSFWPAMSLVFGPAAFLFLVIQVVNSDTKMGAVASAIMGWLSGFLPA